MDLLKSNVIIFNSIAIMLIYLHGSNDKLAYSIFFLIWERYSFIPIVSLFSMIV